MAISDFVALANRIGFNPGNRYTVFISPRAGSFAGLDNRLLSFYCDSATLPGRSFSTSDIKFGIGLTKKMPYNSIYEDLSMTFKLDASMQIKKFFDGWQEKIHNGNTGYMSYQDTYSSDISISVMDKSDRQVYSITCYNAYPISTSQVDLAHATTNEIAKLSVTFAYERFAVNGSGSTNNNGSVR